MAQQESKVPARKSGSARSGGVGRNPPHRQARGGRRRFPRRYLYTAAAVVVAAGAAVGIALAVSGGSSTSVNKHQAAINYTLTNGTKVYGGLGPENMPLEVGPQLAPPNTGLTGATIDGVQCNSSEQLVYHHHAHLAIFVDGKPYSVPIGVGMVPPAEVVNSPQGQFAQGSPTCLYWIHVHAQDGVIHLESPEPRNFELGQFMGIWHVTLSPTQLGSFNGPVTATVDGQPWTGDPNQIPLTEHADIVLNVGTPVVTPPPVSWNGTQL